MKGTIEASQFYDILDKMPKGGLHHIHTTAAPHVEEYIKLTYDPVVAYNEREGMFKVVLGDEKYDGYVKCNDIRNFTKDPTVYDNVLRDQILLTESETRQTESHDIWKAFQPKFSRIGDLCKYKKFFVKLLKNNLENCIAQNIFIVELRHTSGMLFDLYDGERKPVPLLDELETIQNIIDEIKKDCPYFELMLILTSYKIVGHPHVKKMLDHIRIGKEKYPNLIAGFDMVNEEDFTPQISEFMPSILGA